MGQKTSPILLRLGFNQTWQSDWLNAREKNGKSTYSQRLHKDLLIRDWIQLVYGEMYSYKAVQGDGGQLRGSAESIKGVSRAISDVGVKWGSSPIEELERLNALRKKFDKRTGSLLWGGHLGLENMKERGKLGGRGLSRPRVKSKPMQDGNGDRLRQSAKHKEIKVLLKNILELQQHRKHVNKLKEWKCWLKKNASLKCVQGKRERVKKNKERKKKQESLVLNLKCAQLRKGKSILKKNAYQKVFDWGGYRGMTLKYKRKKVPKRYKKYLKWQRYGFWMKNRKKISGWRPAEGGLIGTPLEGVPREKQMPLVFVKAMGYNQDKKKNLSQKCRYWKLLSSKRALKKTGRSMNWGHTSVNVKKRLGQLAAISVNARHSFHLWKRLESKKRRNPEKCRRPKVASSSKRWETEKGNALRTGSLQNALGIRVKELKRMCRATKTQKKYLTWKQRKRDESILDLISGEFPNLRDWIQSSKVQYQSLKDSEMVAESRKTQQVEPWQTSSLPYMNNTRYWHIWKKWSEINNLQELKKKKDRQTRLIMANALRERWVEESKVNKMQVVSEQKESVLWGPKTAISRYLLSHGSELDKNLRIKQNMDEKLLEGIETKRKIRKVNLKHVRIKEKAWELGNNLVTARAGLRQSNQGSYLIPGELGWGLGSYSEIELQVQITQEDQETAKILEEYFDYRLLPVKYRELATILRGVPFEDKRLGGAWEAQKRTRKLVPMRKEEKTKITRKLPTGMRTEKYKSENLKEIRVRGKKIRVRGKKKKMGKKVVKIKYLKQGKGQQNYYLKTWDLFSKGIRQRGSLKAIPQTYSMARPIIKNNLSQGDNASIGINILSKLLISRVKLKKGGGKNKFQVLAREANKQLQDIVQEDKMERYAGIALQFSGRAYGAKKADSFKIIKGCMPRNSLDANISYSKITQETRNGSWGFKFWLHFKKREMFKEFAF